MTSDALRRHVDHAAWTAATLTGATTRTDPFDPDTGATADIGDDAIATTRLTRLAGYAALRAAAEQGIADDVQVALDHGAGAGELATALGISTEAVRKRHLASRRGGQVAVVISRRNRIHHDNTDPRGQYGEVGGTDQYDSDRGGWSIGYDIRQRAEYAIVAVDGTVERIYRLDPDGWEVDDIGKHHFRAADDRPMTDDEIAAAAADGQLPLVPGDPCPTRAGGAYRPHWFGRSAARS